MSDVATSWLNFVSLIEKCYAPSATEKPLLERKQQCSRSQGIRPRSATAEKDPDEDTHSASTDGKQQIVPSKSNTTAQLRFGDICLTLREKVNGHGARLRRKHTWLEEFEENSPPSMYAATHKEFCRNTLEVAKTLRLYTDHYMGELTKEAWVQELLHRVSLDVDKYLANIAKTDNEAYYAAFAGIYDDHFPRRKRLPCVLGAYSLLYKESFGGTLQYVANFTSTLSLLGISGMFEDRGLEVTEDGPMGIIEETHE